MNISGTLKYLKCGTLSIDLQEITQWVYDPATMYTMWLKISIKYFFLKAFVFLFCNNFALVGDPLGCLINLGG